MPRTVARFHSPAATKTLVTFSAIARLSRVQCCSAPFAWIQKGALTSYDGLQPYATIPPRGFPS
jgi:hypothetical protein